MTGRMRVAVAIVAGLVGFATAASAQITGMPLFTNPHYGSGFRVIADYGRPTKSDAGLGDLSVVSAGVSLSLGGLGINATVGVPRTQLSSVQGCIESQTVSCADHKISAAVLAQLRLMGGGANPLALSVFGGAAMDVVGYDLAVQGWDNKMLNIPIGASLGFHTPFGLNIWGAPRINLTRWVNCTGTCPDGMSKFRWAVGADMPILKIFSVRAAFDSGKYGTETVSYWGVGASVGIGGMR